MIQGHGEQVSKECFSADIIPSTTLFNTAQPSETSKSNAACKQDLGFQKVTFTLDDNVRGHESVPWGLEIFACRTSTNDAHSNLSLKDSSTRFWLP